LNVLLFGATGMVGAGVLLECLEDPRVASVLVLGRTSCGVTHPKLREILRSDFFRYDDVLDELRNRDACFFCLGVSAVGMAEADYRRVTRDLTVAAAEAIARARASTTFCYVSGEGTDATERGRLMWARVKGETENLLLAMPLEAYMFRPGFIQPMKGVRTRTRVYALVYALTAPLHPLVRRLFPTHVTTTVNIGRAMIEVGVRGHSRRVLENPDINALAERSV
jgi:uncharacterized protein YbjT (DUF2867 family)